MMSLLGELRLSRQVGLPSGTLISICDVSFWFLLPRRSALPAALPAALPTAQSRRDDLPRHAAPYTLLPCAVKH